MNDARNNHAATHSWVLTLCLAVLLSVAVGALLLFHPLPAHAAVATQQAKIAAAVAVPEWNDNGSPLGVSLTSSKYDEVVDVASDSKVLKECLPGEYRVSFDNDFYLMSDGRLMQTGPEQHVTVREGQISLASLSLTPVDYTKTDAATAQAYIDDAAAYIEDKGQPEKASELKTAALSMLQTSQMQTASMDSGKLVIHYINVGQGDSEFVELPNGQTMLIDAGPASAGMTVVNYIRQLGYSKIDYLVASHPHEDHIGGMAVVMDTFAIGEIWAPKASNNTRTFETFLDKASSKGITAACAGKSIYKSENLNIEVASPRENASFSDLNDASAIIKITYNNKVFAFVGDASSSVTNSALSGHVDILKVGHHGSTDATNATLVSNLSPSFAVISVGKNSYGHPSPKVLSLLSMVSVFRTDTQGTIVATCDGSSLSFDTPAPPTADAAAAIAETETAQAYENANGDETVYITKTGKKYHSDGCSSLSKSKIPISLSEAQADGYTPCSKCR